MRKRPRAGRRCADAVDITAMARRVFVVLLTLVLLQGIAFAGCAESCADEASGAPCAAACIDCLCCAHAARAQVAEVGIRIPHPPTARSGAAEEPSTALGRDPADVFHVPKSVLA